MFNFSESIMKTVKVDVDGVLRDMVGMMCEMYNRQFTQNIQPHDIDDYDIDKFFTKCHTEKGMKPREWFFKHNERELYLNSKPIEGAARAVKTMREKGYHVIVTTDQPSAECKIHTIEWLEKNGIQYDAICFTKEKHAFKGDITVDDNPHVLNLSEDDRKVCIDTPYNRNAEDCERYGSVWEFAETLEHA